MPVLPAHIWLSSSGSKSTGVTLYALSKTGFLISAEAVNTHLQAKKNDIWLNVLPHFHVGGLSIFARAYLTHSEVVDRCMETWGAEKFISWAKLAKATLTSLVPTQLYDLVNAKLKAPETLRAIVIGGAALDDDLYFAARELGYNVLPSFGMTECVSQVATAPLESLQTEKRPQLQILPHVELSIIEGRLAVKSPALFSAKANWKMGEQKTFTEVLWRVGEWYVTSDLAKIEGQNLIPLGRGDEQVKISGELVQLRELNLLFQKISNNSHAVLIAQDEPRRGSEVALILSESAISMADKWVEEFNSQVIPVAKIRAAYFVNNFLISDLGKPMTAKLQSQLGMQT